MWDYNRRSDIIGKNGYYDFGLCQINEGYHPEIVNDPNFSSVEFQLNKCLELYRGGTVFYGAFRKNVAAKNIIFF